MKLLIRQLLYNPRYAKPAQDQLGQLLLPSFFGILLCAVCMAGSTYAWFTATTAAPTQSIQAANYAVTVEAGKISFELGDAVTFEKGTHTLTVTATGTGSGYLKIQEGDDIRYTEQIGAGETAVFKVECTGDATVTACWGTYAGFRDPDVLKQNTAAEE